MVWKWSFGLLICFFKAVFTCGWQFMHSKCSISILYLENRQYILLISKRREQFILDRFTVILHSSSCTWCWKYAWQKDFTIVSRGISPQKLLHY
jgi:hypothetical protein